MRLRERVTNGQMALVTRSASVSHCGQCVINYFMRSFLYQSRCRPSAKRMRVYMIALRHARVPPSAPKRERFRQENISDPGYCVFSVCARAPNNKLLSISTLISGRWPRCARRVCLRRTQRQRPPMKTRARLAAVASSPSVVTQSFSLPKK